MKKLLFIFFTLLFFIDYSVNSQTNTTGKNKSDIINISQEKIFIHHNTSFLLTGEYLYYKVYCLNTENNNLSNFSKIAYVELINNERKTVFKHKIILKNGMGYGDYFVPTSLSSGNYKLISYTQWMRNSDIHNFYQNDISIINPFQENQKSILNDKSPSNIDQKNKSVNYNISSTEQKTTNRLVNLQVDSENFTNRNKVTLNIQALKLNSSYGNYSLSVRKIDDLEIPTRNTSLNYLNSITNNTTVTNKTIAFLPELRGELLSGKVEYIESGSPAVNIKVALSIPGKNYIFKIANTNKNGVYYFNIDTEYDTKNANIQIIDTERKKYNLVIDYQLPVDYSSLEFYNLKITPDDKEIILAHSIGNQIENAYSSKKPDSIKNIETPPPFFNNKEKEFLLDDYTRFNTLKETFIEIIPEIYSQQKDEKFTFHVRIYDKEIETGLTPLVLIDGNLIQDQTELIDFNANKIEKINVVNDMYIYGSKLFEGVISIYTFDGNYKISSANNDIKNIQLSKPLDVKKYFNQIYYKNINSDRIPDFRRQLLWNPAIQLNKKDKTITFYTSDVHGKYEICLEGFTTEGKPVSLKKVIYVNDNPKE